MILNFNQERHSALGGNELRSQACICPSDGPQPRVFWIWAPCEADFAKEFAVAIWLTKTSFIPSWSFAIVAGDITPLRRQLTSFTPCTGTWDLLLLADLEFIVATAVLEESSTSTESDRSHKAELETPLCSFVKGSISSYIEEHSWQWHLRELLHYSSYDNSKVIAKAFAASRLAAGGCTWYLWCPYRREERSQTSKSCSPRRAKSLYSTAANAANRQTHKFVVPRLQSCNSSRRKVLSEETRARPPIWPRSAPKLSHFYCADLYCAITCYHATIQHQQICIHRWYKYASTYRIM